MRISPGNMMEPGYVCWPVLALAAQVTNKGRIHAITGPQKDNFSGYGGDTGPSCASVFCFFVV